MENNLKGVLKKLDLPETGRYDNHFYVINLEDSNEYAKIYTKLDKKAVNTEEPNFGRNTTGSTVKITNYFEFESDGAEYNIFLIADFLNGKYYVKIGQK